MMMAEEAAGRAYSPYSRIRVGCALETGDGEIFTACNVENASYGLTICAERAAIFQAVARLGPDMKWVRAAVIAVGHEFPPCGACRQVLAEFAGVGARVIHLRQGQLCSSGIGELLPMAFSADAMP